MTGQLMVTKIHGTTVGGGHLRLKFLDNRESLLSRHAVGTSGSDADDSVCLFLNGSQNLAKCVKVAHWHAVASSSVDMHHRGTGLGSVNGLLGDLLRRRREVWGHGGCVDSAGNRGRDHNFLLLRHRINPF